MNRRNFLNNLKIFCAFYGLQDILSAQSFAQSQSPKRFASFIIKYTGGTTEKTGLGRWTFNESLKPLMPFKDRIAIIQGMDSKFDTKMNSHAASQICCLSGSMTGFVMRETAYPTGNLLKYTNGDGKSMRSKTEYHGFTRG